jgi:putative transposase
MTGVMLDRLKAICRNTAAKWRCEVQEFNGEADHAYLPWR